MLSLTGHINNLYSNFITSDLGLPQSASDAVSVATAAATLHSRWEGKGTVAEMVRKHSQRSSEPLETNNSIDELDWREQKIDKKRKVLANSVDCLTLVAKTTHKKLATSLHLPSFLPCTHICSDKLLHPEMLESDSAAVVAISRWCVYKAQADEHFWATLLACER